MKLKCKENCLSVRDASIATGKCCVLQVLTQSGHWQMCNHHTVAATEGNSTVQRFVKDASILSAHTLSRYIDTNKLT